MVAKFVRGINPSHNDPAGSGHHDGPDRLAHRPRQIEEPWGGSTLMYSTGISYDSTSKSISQSQSQSAPRPELCTLSSITENREQEHVLRDQVVVDLETVTIGDIEEERFDNGSDRISSTRAIWGSFSTGRGMATCSVSSSSPPNETSQALNTMLASPPSTTKIIRHSTTLSSLVSRFSPQDLRKTQSPLPGPVACRHLPSSITQLTAQSQYLTAKTTNRTKTRNYPEIPEFPEWTPETISATSTPEMPKILDHLDVSKPPSLAHSKETGGDEIASSGAREHGLPHFHRTEESFDEEIFGLSKDELSYSTGAQPAITSWLRLTPELGEDTSDESEAEASRLSFIHPTISSIH